MNKEDVESAIHLYDQLVRRLAFDGEYNYDNEKEAYHNGIQAMKNWLAVLEICDDHIMLEKIGDLVYALAESER